MENSNDSLLDKNRSNENGEKEVEQMPVKTYGGVFCEKRVRVSLRIPVSMNEKAKRYVKKPGSGYRGLNDLMLDVLSGGLARAPQVGRWCGEQVRKMGRIRQTLYGAYRKFKNDAVGEKVGKYKPAGDPIWQDIRQMSDNELKAWVEGDLRNGLPEIKRLRQQGIDLQRNSRDGWHIVFELLKTMKWTSARMVRALADLGYTQANGYKDGIGEWELKKCNLLHKEHSEMKRRQYLANKKAGLPTRRAV